MGIITRRKEADWARGLEKGLLLTRGLKETERSRRRLEELGDLDPVILVRQTLLQFPLIERHRRRS